MLTSTIAQTLSPEDFKRRFGVQRPTFDAIVKALPPAWRPPAKLGVQPKLGLAEQVLVALEYWQEYRTDFHIGSRWRVSESTVCRVVHWVEEQLMRSGCFRLSGKKR